MPDTPEEIAARQLDKRYPPLAEDHTMTADEWRRAYFALADVAQGQIDKAYAHIDALTAATREVIESWDCILPLSYSEQEVVAAKIVALRRSLEPHDA